MMSQSRVAALLCAFMKCSSTFSRVQLDCRAFRLTALPSTELKKKLLMLLLMNICGHRRTGQQPARRGTSGAAAAAARSPPCRGSSS